MEVALLNKILTFLYGSGPFKGYLRVVGSRFHTLEKLVCPITGIRLECPIMDTI